MKARQEYLLCTSFLQLDTQSKNVKKKQKKKNQILKILLHSQKHAVTYKRTTRFETENLEGSFWYTKFIGFSMASTDSKGELPLLNRFEVI